MTEKADTQPNGDGAAVVWPDPSPLSSWWDIVMYGAAVPDRSDAPSSDGKEPAAVSRLRRAL